MLIPTTPNRPLSDPNECEQFGEMRLRFNASLGLLENSAFDVNIVSYDDNYQNNQALSDAFKKHMLNVLDILQKKYTKGTKIVEVGCGKGEFVELILACGGHFDIEGFDGAYEGVNPKIYKRYLSAEDRINADVVVLRHVLEHIQKPHEFLELLNSIFGDVDIYIEVPDYQWILENQCFFDITYEHVNYFLPSSFHKLFSLIKCSDSLFENQYQYVIANLGDLNEKFSKEYINSNWSYLELDDLFPSLDDLTAQVIKEAKKGSSSIYIWGAATKGVMFFHHLKLKFNNQFHLCKAAIDINSKKYGKYMPSSGLPIISPEDYFIRAKASDILIVANPNYKDEIIKTVKNNIGQLPRIIYL